MQTSEMGTLKEQDKELASGLLTPVYAIGFLSSDSGLWLVTQTCMPKPTPGQDSLLTVP